MVCAGLFVSPSFFLASTTIEVKQFYLFIHYIFISYCSFFWICIKIDCKLRRLVVMKCGSYLSLKKTLYEHTLIDTHMHAMQNCHKTKNSINKKRRKKI